MIAHWLNDSFLRATVLFETPDGKGGFSPHGTGVLLIHNGINILATCRHIVLRPDGTPFQGLHATINMLSGEPSRKNLQALNQQHGMDWFFHREKNIDLAILPIPIATNVEDARFVTDNQVEEFESIPVGDDVFFLGYPLGLGVKDVPKLSPLVRVGVISLKNNDKTFLIDANVYPGSSGSPVFYKPVLAQTHGETTNIGTGRPSNFLGLISMDIAAREVAVSARTGRVRAIFEDNAGLGVVQSYTLIKEILYYPEVQEKLNAIRATVNQRLVSAPQPSTQLPQGEA